MPCSTHSATRASTPNGRSRGSGGSRGWFGCAASDLMPWKRQFGWWSSFSAAMRFERNAALGTFTCARVGHLVPVDRDLPGKGIRAVLARLHRGERQFIAIELGVLDDLRPRLLLAGDHYGAGDLSIFL